MISGAMYYIDPKKVVMPFFMSVSSNTLESPQSVSLMCPSSFTSIFSGLSYLQTMPVLCRNSTATIIQASMSLIVLSGKMKSCFLEQKYRSPLGKYSITMYMFSSFWKIYVMLVRKGCLRIAGISFVCSKLSSLIFVLGMIFMAKRMFVDFYYASTTKPQEPLPKYLTHWQFSGPLVFFYSFLVYMQERVSDGVLVGGRFCVLAATIVLSCDG